MQEMPRKVRSGWGMLPITIIAFLVAPALIALGALLLEGPSPRDPVVPVVCLVLAPLVFLAAILLALGLFTLQPNEARVLVLFGKYVGTVRDPGFHWANPFSVRHGPTGNVQAPRQTIRNRMAPQEAAPAAPAKSFRLSLRARNFQTETLKVNDQRGNPIEIGAVVVWRIEDTAKAFFDVDEYEDYVRVQSETAVRHLASRYPYDHAQDEAGDEITLRGHSEAIGKALAEELQDRLVLAGVTVMEARLTHLAYAPEIAGVMLRRQQAEAVIAARQKIVHGAVSMVEMAISELSEKNLLDLDEERKAAMVGNLLVVLCGEREAEPIINTGTLYH
jgi:regulator of protease activity HflC (stomatin/prohibitin superfamily)